MTSLSTPAWPHSVTAYSTWEESLIRYHTQSPISVITFDCLRMTPLERPHPTLYSLCHSRLSLISQKWRHTLPDISNELDRYQLLCFKNPLKSWTIQHSLDVECFWRHWRLQSSCHCGLILNTQSHLVFSTRLTGRKKKHLIQIFPLTFLIFI